MKLENAAIFPANLYLARKVHDVEILMEYRMK